MVVHLHLGSVLVDGKAREADLELSNRQIDVAIVGIRGVRNLGGELGSPLFASCAIGTTITFMAPWVASFDESLAI